MLGTIRSLLDEPQAPDPPARVWRDWALVVALLIAVVVELAVRDDIIWRPFVTALTLVTIPTVLWRRTRPLATLTVVFAVFMVVNLTALVAGVTEIGLNTEAFVLILVYSLFRWGSGRQAFQGLAVMVTALVVSFFTDVTSIGDAIGATIVLLAPAELGGMIRYKLNLQASQIDRIKNQEREQLARELHDTVAHHVSAIVIQAQAGQAVSVTDPDGAVTTLEAIEEEASRTLAEMRRMVGALREGGETDLAPQRGVRDIERLTANDRTGGPAVHVELNGDLSDLGPSIDAALYRLAQESITNATRHAKHATRVDVKVTGDDETVHLTVTDDGVTSPGSRSNPGFGLIGMAERAKLLGGSMKAGPGATRGWVTQAVLPRGGATG